MDLQMWEGVFGDYLLGETLASCKVVSEMNLQFVNIIGETLTNLADFSRLSSFLQQDIANCRIISEKNCY